MRWQCVQPAAEVNRTDAHPPLVKGVVPDRGARDVPLRLVVRVTLTRPFSDEEAAAFERDPGVFAALYANGRAARACCLVCLGGGGWAYFCGLLSAIVVI